MQSLNVSNVIRFQPYGRTEQTAAAMEAAKDSEETLPNVLIYTKDNQHTPTKIEVRDTTGFVYFYTTDNLIEV